MNDLHSKSDFKLYLPKSHAIQAMMEKWALENNKNKEYYENWVKLFNGNEVTAAFDDLRTNEHSAMLLDVTAFKGYLKISK